MKQIPLHGGSLRLFIRHTGHSASPAVGDLLALEGHHGITSSQYYADFAERVQNLRQEVVDLITQLRADGASVAAYGAAAKGTVLLNHFGLNRSHIDFVVDRNEHKHGLMMPGVGIPILPASELERIQPDFTLLLAWNFADEILEQQHSYRDAGGKFIIPVPSVSLR